MNDDEDHHSDLENPAPNLAIHRQSRNIKGRNGTRRSGSKNEGLGVRDGELGKDGVSHGGD